MTGRGAGFCAGYGVAGFANPAVGRGFMGRGRGGGGRGGEKLVLRHRFDRMAASRLWMAKFLSGVNAPNFIPGKQGRGVEHA